MLTATKLDALALIVNEASPNALRSKKGRKALAQTISVRLGLWLPNVQSFADEMIGLNFFNAEDRALFVQFAERAL